MNYTQRFNPGDRVFIKDKNCEAIILSNYGNALEGDRGEVRTDAEGNVFVFEYSPGHRRTGYNLIKLNT